jgi:hypothetical protein
MLVMKRVTDKEQWLLDQARASNFNLDVLNREFTDAYIEQFDPKVQHVNWGAHKIPELGRLLSKLFHEGKLERFRSHLGAIGNQVGLVGFIRMNFRNCQIKEVNDERQLSVLRIGTS